MTEKSSAWREEYHFANCVIRSDTRELLRDGVAQKIERRSFDLILYLLKLEGRVASKDELLEHVWGNHFVSESVIAQSIMKVRKAMGITGKEPGPIKTVHRVGYRLAGEVRRATHSTPTYSQTLRPSGSIRILWLPTDCALPRADLSWVRYGLISVATHVLHGYGVPTVPASEAIRLHESLENADGGWDPVRKPAIREIGLPMVRSRVTAVEDRFRLEWWMQIDGSEHGNQIEGLAPAELALRAAREVALIVRLRWGLQPVSGQEAKFWEEAGKLVSLAVSLDQSHKTLPLLALCADLPECPLPIWAELVMVMAHRADQATPACAQRLAQLASSQQDRAHEGWAHLCNAWYLLYQHRRSEAVEQAMTGIALVRHATSHACHARALMVASHLFATVGMGNEAVSLSGEAARAVSRMPCPDMVCRAHLLQCELAHLGMGETATAEAQADALTSARSLGSTNTTAWLTVLQGLQSCTRGEWSVCRRALEAGLQAAEKADAPLARLFSHLQLGSFRARCGDQDGLSACIEAVDQPVLRAAPMGTAVGRWLRARHCFLAGDAAQALPLAEQALGEMADFGVWCGEDQWLLVAQIALVAGNRRAAAALLQRLQARCENQPLQSRKATALAVEGMLEYAEGNASKALLLFEQACKLARGTLMSNILLFGHTWLTLIDGRNPSPAQLAPSGQWVEFTREGRHLRATLLNKPYWAMAKRQPPVLLETAARPTPHRVADVAEGGQSSYARYLPLPV